MNEKCTSKWITQTKIVNKKRIKNIIVKTYVILNRLNV